MPQSCSMFEFTYTTMFSKHKRLTKKEGARQKRETTEKENKSVSNSTIMPPLHSMHTCSHTSGGLHSDNHASSFSLCCGEYLAVQMWSQRFSSHDFTHMAPQHKLLQLFSKRTVICSIVGKKIKLADFVKYCNLWEIYVTFKSNLVHIQLSPFVWTLKPNAFVKWMWLHYTW